MSKTNPECHCWRIMAFPPTSKVHFQEAFVTHLLFWKEHCKTISQGCHILKAKPLPYPVSNWIHSMKRKLIPGKETYQAPAPIHSRLLPKTTIQFKTRTNRLTRDRVESAPNVSVGNSYLVGPRSCERGRFGGGRGVRGFSIVVLVCRVCSYGFGFRG